jgi:hypothetical protein
MVRVPEYNRTETLRPAFRQGIDTQASAETFGAAVGKGLQQVGQAVGQVGEAAQAIQRFDAENKAKSSDNGLSEAIAKAGYGEGGYFTLSGQAAVDGLDKYKQTLQELKKQHGAELNPIAGQMYGRAADARIQSEVESGLKYQGAQRKANFIAVSDARVATFKNDAMLRFADPAAVTKNIAAGLMELDEKAAKVGTPPELLALQKSQFTTQTHADVALRIADSPDAGGALAADKYINDHKDAFTDADILKSTRDALEKPIARARTVSAVDGFEKVLPPPDWSGGAGGVGSGYDVVLGNGQYGRPSKPITQMSLGEVINFGQKTLIPNSRAAGVGRDARGLLGSSAVGAYQITQETLSRYGPRVLGDNWRQTPFTADVQDRIAEAIFNDSKSLGPGLVNVWRGLKTGANAQRVSQMPWSQAKLAIAAGESGGSSGGGKPATNSPEAWLTDMYSQADRQLVPIVNGISQYLVPVQ